MTRRTSVARLAGAALAVILGTVPALAEISGVTFRTTGNVKFL